MLCSSTMYVQCPYYLLKISSSCRVHCGVKTHFVTPKETQREDFVVEYKVIFPLGTLWQTDINVTCFVVLSQSNAPTTPAPGELWTRLYEKRRVRRCGNSFVFYQGEHHT